MRTHISTVGIVALSLVTLLTSGCAKKSSGDSETPPAAPAVLEPVAQPESDDENGPNSGMVTPGPFHGLTPSIARYEFITPSNYTYDPQWIKVSFGIASLLGRDRTDDSGDATKGFGGGTHDKTAWVENDKWLTMNTAGLIAGSATYTSRIMVSTGASPWNALSWTPVRPYGKPLPNNLKVESGYPQGNVSMDKNILLYHMDLANWTGTDFEVVDDSGKGNYGTAIGGLSTTNVDCLFDRCAEFDGANDYIYLDNPATNSNSTFDDQVDVRTASFWINATNDSGSSPRVVYEEGGTVNGLNIYQYGSQICAGAWSNSTAWSGEWLCASMTINKWQHVALVFNSIAPVAKMALFVNGALAGEVAVPSYVNAHSGDNSIGAMIQDTRVLPAHGGQLSGDGNFFLGKMDEVSFYDRSLSAAEILNHYRRGAYRVRIQVRTCATSNCSSATFVGPDGTASSYFTELNSSVVNGTPEFDFVAPNSEYFQYSVLMLSEDPLEGPKLSAVAIGPDRYYAGKPSITANSGIPYRAFAPYSAIRIQYTSKNQGNAKLQLSPNGTDYYYYNGADWVAATTPSMANTDVEASAQLVEFGEKFGPGVLFTRIFLNSFGTQRVEVEAVQLELFWKF